MGRAEELFPDIAKQRKKRQSLMHFCDVGVNDCVGKPIIANMKCNRCGHDGGWWEFDTATEVKRGIPCPNCNLDQRE